MIRNTPGKKVRTRKLKSAQSRQLCINHQTMSRFALLITMLFTATFAQAQETVNKVNVGRLTNGNPVITNEKSIMNVIRSGLSPNASVSQLYILSAPDNTSFVAYANVTNDSRKVSVVGVTLLNDGKGGIWLPDNLGSEGIGGGLKFTCTGNPCSLCIPRIVWVKSDAGRSFPVGGCKCECGGCEDHICNVYIEVTIDAKLF